jgi:hypothetical protein
VGLTISQAPTISFLQSTPFYGYAKQLRRGTGTKREEWRKEGSSKLKPLVKYLTGLIMTVPLLAVPVLTESRPIYSLKFKCLNVYATFSKRIAS